MTGIIYRNPFLYRGVMKLLMGKTYKQKYKLLESYINKKDFLSVLDIGCGDCQLHEYIKHKHKYIGCDINQNFIDSANHRGITVFKGDILNFPDGVKFDCVIFSELLHYFYPNQEQIIKRLLEITNKVLIIIEPNEHLAQHKNKYIRTVAQMINNPGTGRPTKFYSTQELFKLYNKYGATETITFDRIHIVVFRK